MLIAAGVEGNLVRVGVAAGFVAVATYLLKAFVPDPGAVKTGFLVYRGPVMVVAFVGLFGAGPLESIRFAVVFIQVARHLGWLKQSGDQISARGGPAESAKPPR